MTPQFTIHRAFKKQGESLPLHAHSEGQLTFAASGIVQVHTDQGMWLVPPQLAAWIPSGARHRIEIMADVELWIVLWQASALQNWALHSTLDRPFVLQITPFLRSLLTEAVSVDPDLEKAELIVRLIIPELEALPMAPTFLPMPTSSTGQRVADIILDDSQNLIGLQELASIAATSVRTVSRLFPVETGLTFKAWRQRARIVQAMEQLGRGKSPTKVALESGFNSTAAFSHAFRQVTAMTPKMFMAPDVSEPDADR
jgi:AraC-like DNA-binding protein